MKIKARESGLPNKYRLDPYYWAQVWGTSSRSYRKQYDRQVRAWYFDIWRRQQQFPELNAFPFMGSM